jgi:hypothetical protein
MMPSSTPSRSQQLRPGWWSHSSCAPTKNRTSLGSSVPCARTSATISLRTLSQGRGQPEILAGLLFDTGAGVADADIDRRAFGLEGPVAAAADVMAVVFGAVALDLDDAVLAHQGAAGIVLDFAAIVHERPAAMAGIIARPPPPAAEERHPVDGAGFLALDDAGVLIAAGRIGIERGALVVDGLFDIAELGAKDHRRRHVAILVQAFEFLAGLLAQAVVPDRAFRGNLLAARALPDRDAFVRGVVVDAGPEALPGRAIGSHRNAPDRAAGHLFDTAPRDRATGDTGRGRARGQPCGGGYSSHSSPPDATKLSQQEPSKAIVRLPDPIPSRSPS